MNAKIDITFKRIETKRLILRPFKEEDLEDFYAYARIPGVGEMAGWPHHENKETSKQILSSFIEHKKTFAIVDKETKKVIGSLGIENYKENLLPEFSLQKGRELGYVLAKDCWGRGLMPEAVSAVIEYLFEEVALDFIVCAYFKENIQSKRTQEKCGFLYYKDFTYDALIGKKESKLTILRKEDYFYGKN